MKDLLKKAQEGAYAVGSFSVANMEMKWRVQEIKQNRKYRSLKTSGIQSSTDFLLKHQVCLHAALSDCMTLHLIHKVY